MRQIAGGHETGHSSMMNPSGFGKLFVPE